MGRMYESTGTDGLLRTFVHLPGGGKDLGVRHDGGTHLLITIHGIFLLERGHRIKLGIKGSLHLQLIVGIELGIFLYSLLLNHIVTVVLIERVLKLRTRHVYTSHSHHDGVG